tara:strand:- start:509 stop:964 length:456 start_codon:yes stop_codon:yes gene_type:complete
MQYLTLESIGKRLEAERIRLDLRNLDVCTSLEIHPNTYRNYETGKRDMPSSLMAQLSTIGFDITFVLTGRRIQELIAINEVNNVVGGSNNPPSFGNPYLTNQFNDVTITHKNDSLLECMYQVEKTFQSAGITAREEYTFSDLVQSAISKNK